MKTITPIRYRGCLAFAMVTTALIMLPRLAIGAETMTVTNQLGGFSQTFPPNNGPFELYTSVAHSQGETYVVMPDATGVPKVTQISEQGNGIVTHLTVNLDQSDYRALNDAHNGFSIGIDKDGYLHIAGDMHAFGYSDGRQGVPHPETTYPTANEIYPVRYQFNHPSIPVGERATILYWVSNKPRDISSGFTFTGAKDNPRRIPGTGWSYGRFFNDRNGELFYSSRGAAVGRFIGALGVTLNAYDVATRTWTTRGAIPPASSYANQSVFGDSQTVLFWSEAGEPPTASKPNRGYRNYQVYQAGFNFDLN
ncbi:MAG: BNR-4 repeat-containing protein, partial [Verrucomicrobiota bacterium]